MVEIYLIYLVFLEVGSGWGSSGSGYGSGLGDGSGSTTSNLIGSKFSIIINKSTTTYFI